jgi:hypothetical protein
MALSQRQNQLALGTEERVRSDENRFNFRAGNIFEGSFDITGRAGIQNTNVLAKRSRRRFHFTTLNVTVFFLWI